MIGQTILHYRVVEKLGEGGMGIVYKAEDTKLNRLVALKFLAPEFTRDEVSKERFTREARAASALDHPNICTIHEIGETDDGRSFICMAYYAGKTLKERIEEGPFSVENALTTTLAVAKGLVRAHEAGIVHCDIKPANILLTDRGEVKILDFGVAKLMGETRSHGSDSRLGTAAYMSPEQTMGGEVDHRSDLFSLGVILYEMVTGQRPFRGEHESALLYAITNLDPIPPKQLVPHISTEVEQIILRLLAKDIAQRYQSAEEVVHDVKKVLGLDVMRRSPRLSVRRVATIVVIGLTVMIVLVLLQRRTTLPLDEQRIRISVIPFQDMTGSADWKDWPMVIQSLIVGELTGIEQFGIVDPFSLNNLMSASFGTAVAERSVNVYDILKSLDADYMVGGNITQTGSQLRIVCTLTDISTREVRFSTEAVATGEADLESTVKVLVEKLLDFFQVKVFQSNLIQDLRPWLPQRTRNISALRAFMEAAELIYRNERGVESLLQQAVALDSMFISARVWLISVLVGRGKHEEARTHHQFLTRIERQASPFDRAMIRWAGGYMSGNVHTQEIALREALQYSSGNFILQMNLGIVYYNQKRFRASLEVLSDAVRLGWSYPQLYYLYAVNLKQLGQWTKAKQFLEDNLTMASPYRLTYSLLAALHLQAGDTARYRFYEDQLIQLSLHRGDSLHRTYGSQARYLASEGFYHEAARLYRQALQLEPRREEYKLGYGEVLLLLGELHEAERQFRDLLGSNPEFKSAYFFLGELYTRQGDSIRAAQYFRQFLSLDSTSIMGQKARRRLQHSVE